MGAIYRKELKSYFINMTGYIIVGFLIAAAGFLFKYINLQQGYPKFEYTVYEISFVLLLIVPLLTMRTFSEERHQKTDLLLYSLPISLSGTVLAKFFAAVTVFLIPTGIMAFFPLILKQFGDISLTNAYGALIAFFLLGCAMLAIGIFVSTLTSSQMIAAIITFAALLCTYLMSLFANMISSTAIVSALCFVVLAALLGIIVYRMTKSYIAAYIVFIILAVAVAALYLIKSSVFEGAFGSLLSALSLFDRLDGFTNDSFDFTGILYYLSVTGAFLFLSVQSVDKKRWS